MQSNQNPNNRCVCSFQVRRRSTGQEQGRGVGRSLISGLRGLARPLIWEEFPTGRGWVGARIPSHKYTNEQHALAMTLPVGNSFGALK